MLSDSFVKLWINTDKRENLSAVLIESPRPTYKETYTTVALLYPVSTEDDDGEVRHINTMRRG